LDVVNKYAFEKLVVEHRIDWLVHLTSLLSASGEKNPELAIEVNVGGLFFLKFICLFYSLISSYIL